MTKSIEEQREELAEKYVSLSAPEMTRLQMSWDFKNGFDSGAKASDEQWLKVVNELREALDNIMTASQKSEESHALNVYYTAHDTLANTDQMLKEMNINKGE